MGTRTAVKPPVDAAGAVDAKNSVHRSLENHRTVFHSAHKASLLTVNRGHFYRVKTGDISISL